MEEKKENSKSRLLEFLDVIGISQYKCAQMCGWASSYLNGLKGDFGADKLATMMKVFPTLNVLWLITGEGNMFKSKSEPDNESKNDKVLESPKEGATIPFDVFMQTTDRYNKIIAEKDAEIEELKMKISTLQK